MAAKYLEEGMSRVYLRYISNLWQVLSKRGSQVAIAMALGYGVAHFLAPTPLLVTRFLHPAPHASRAEDTVSAWFGTQGAPVRVQLLGVIHSAPTRGTAILRVDASEPRVYKEGALIAQGVYLTKVEADRIQIEQQGQTQSILMPAHPVPLPKHALQRLP